MIIRLSALLCLLVGCAATPEPKPQAAPTVVRLPEEESEMTLIEKPRAAPSEERPSAAPEPARMSKKHAPLVVVPSAPKSK